MGPVMTGDDIVITDGRVASEYRSAIDLLGVKISEAKSLVSNTGALEFAKRFWVRNVSVDLSPIAVKAVLGAHIPRNRAGFIALYGLKKFSTFRRLGGAGYRTLSQTRRPSAGPLERLEWTLWLKEKSICLSWFFGEGRFLTPEEYWWLYRETVELMKPPTLKQSVDPDALVTDLQGWFLEYTQLRVALRKGWLKYYMFWLPLYRVAERLDLGQVTGWMESRWVSLLDQIWDSPALQDWFLVSGIPPIIQWTRMQRLKERLFRSDRPKVLCLISRAEVWICMLDGPIVVWDEPFLARLGIPYNDGSPRKPVEESPVLCVTPQGEGCSLPVTTTKQIGLHVSWSEVKQPNVEIEDPDLSGSVSRYRFFSSGDSIGLFSDNRYSEARESIKTKVAPVVNPGPD
ncbi:hypothetical protein VNO78_35250 [Psophocarpus tetragonolobus]|uniref:Uncharacterized protein n=1 Tax=Psophocarpus tetragonolobus TaxID=3891 RepID=A0AAN9RGY4_PSOTE